MRRAILFPTDDKSPQWVWVPSASAKTESQSYATLEHLLGQDQNFDSPALERQEICCNIVLSRDVEHVIDVWFRSDFLGDGSKINASIVHATQELNAYPWRGPLIALGRKGLGESLRGEDLNMSDYRHIIDFLTCFNSTMTWSGRAREYDWTTKLAGRVQGVRINCAGDKHTFGRKTFEQVTVPLRHPLFYCDKGFSQQQALHRGALSKVSELVGMPILLTRYPFKEAWKDLGSGLQQPLRNPAATSLFLHCDPTTTPKNQWSNEVEWGCAPTDWARAAGSVLVLHKKQKPLLKEHMEVLCAFCQHKVQPLLVSGEGSIEEVFAKITPETFKAFFGEYRAIKIASDPESGWLNVSLL